MKPIRLIELFAGYGSQAFALKYLGIDFKSYRICEWAVKSIQAYKDAHFKDDNTDYSKIFPSFEGIVNLLVELGISANYNEPMSKEQVKRMGEKKCRQVLNNIVATHNLVNICKTKAEDLMIVDTDKYNYIMTYSFPCQDLSLAGKGAGMTKGSGTRSGMLWEVERILTECKELPQVLLMENVPQVHGSKNKSSFEDWCKFLESLGYKNFWQDLNAKDFGVPQNRNRCFMVSLLSGKFEFPVKRELKVKLKDLLEREVDEKYYLSERAINGINNTQFNCSKLSARTEHNGVMPTLCARDYKDPKLVIDKGGNKFIINNTKQLRETIENNNLENGTSLDLYNRSCHKNIAQTLDTGYHNSQRVCVGEQELPIGCEIRSDEGIRTFKDNVMGTLRTIDACGDKCIIEPTLKQILRIRKLTPKECFRLMGVKDEDFENIAKNQSNASLYHLAGDSIVVNVLMEIFKGVIYD